MTNHPIKRWRKMELHTFYPENSAPFKARARVFQHDPYSAYVCLQSKKAAKKFQGCVRWGKYSAVVRGVEIGK